MDGVAQRDVFECVLEQANDVVEPYIQIAIERTRQQEKFGGTVGDVANPDTSNHFRLAVLTEELGEIARAIIEHEGDERLAEEVTQLAAVAVAWLQSMQGDR